jgi:hypothetical protein
MKKLVLFLIVTICLSCNDGNDSVKSPSALKGYAETSFFIANWDKVPDASSYEIDVSLDNFSSTLSNYIAFPVEALPYTPQSIKIEGLQPATNYQYRVRAKSGSSVSKNSNIIELCTNPENDILTNLASDTTNRDKVRKLLIGKWEIYAEYFSTGANMMYGNSTRYGLSGSNYCGQKSQLIFHDDGTFEIISINGEKGLSGAYSIGYGYYNYPTAQLNLTTVPSSDFNNDFISIGENGQFLGLWSYSLYSNKYMTHRGKRLRRM